MKKDSLQKFIYDKSLPLVGEKTIKSTSRYDNIKLPQVTVFTAIDHVKNPKGFQYVANRVRKVAAEYVGKFVFSIASKDELSYTLDYYGLPSLSGKSDIGAGLHFENTYYKMNEAFSPENLKKFIEAFKAGSLIGKEKV